MKVIDYTPAYRDSFVRMNRDWICRLFVLEEADLQTFDGLEKTLAAGGKIFLCVEDEDGSAGSGDEETEQKSACGCVLLTPVRDGVFELEKFASVKRGGGRMLLDAVFAFARRSRLKKIILVTNTRCEAAIHLYRAYGFEEVPVDRSLYPYARANIAFERVFERSAVKNSEEREKRETPAGFLSGMKAGNPKGEC